MSRTGWNLAHRLSELARTVGRAGIAAGLAGAALAGVGLMGTASVAMADVTLPTLFGDHMVVQRDKPISIWGWAEAGEQVTVSLAGQSAEVTVLPSPAGAVGELAEKGLSKWRVILPPMAAGGPHELKVSCPHNEVVVKDVLVGEVWVCSGQSNMEWALGGTDGAEEAIKAADLPKVRVFKIKHLVADKPQDNVPDATWQAITPKNAGGVSAVAYYFGKELSEELDVPVGLIQTAWGGTRAEAWTPREALVANPILRPIPESWDKQVAAWDQAKVDADYAKRLDAWKKQEAEAKEAGRNAPPRPQKPANPAESQHRDATLYNAMIAPLIPYSVRGAIWYQGESNVGRAQQYQTLFSTMIQSWRNAWGGEPFPFLFVQLAPFNYGGGRGGALPELWEAQLKTLSLPNTGMAVITDIGNPTDIHPRNKKDVGHRLALWALANTYGQEIAYSGPLYRSASFSGGKATIRFDHADGLASRDGKPLTDFQIAGTDRNFVDAKAEIGPDGKTIVVSAEEVTNPVAVRFGWDQVNNPNLVNGTGIPASPFRTDAWPGVTDGQLNP